jgi:dephospho-CoA kinase
MKIKAVLTPQSRLYQCPVPLIGLTGGIATGKSQVGQILKDLGHPVLEADYLIKCIYQQKETIEFVKKVFPQAMIGQTIDFPILRQLFFNHKQEALELENYLYKQIPNMFEVERLKLKAINYLIYDIPLLYEKKLESFFDTIILVYAPRSVQKARTLSRDGSTIETIEKILDAQMDIEEKKQISPWVIENTKGLNELQANVENWLAQVMED